MFCSVTAASASSATAWTSSPGWRSAPPTAARSSTCRDPRGLARRPFIARCDPVAPGDCVSPSPAGGASRSGAPGTPWRLSMPPPRSARRRDEFTRAPVQKPLNVLPLILGGALAVFLVVGVIVFFVARKGNDPAPPAPEEQRKEAIERLKGPPKK